MSDWFGGGIGLSIEPGSNIDDIVNRARAEGGWTIEGLDRASPFKPALSDQQGTNASNGTSPAHGLRIDESYLAWIFHTTGVHPSMMRDAIAQKAHQINRKKDSGDDKPDKSRSHHGDRSSGGGSYGGGYYSGGSHYGSSYSSGGPHYDSGSYSGGISYAGGSYGGRSYNGRPASNTQAKRKERDANGNSADDTHVNPPKRPLGDLSIASNSSSKEHPTVPSLESATSSRVMAKTKASDTSDKNDTVRRQVTTTSIATTSRNNGAWSGAKDTIQNSDVSSDQGALPPVPTRVEIAPTVARRTSTATRPKRLQPSKTRKTLSNGKYNVKEDGNARTVTGTSNQIIKDIDIVPRSHVSEETHVDCKNETKSQQPVTTAMATIGLGDSTESANASTRMQGGASDQRVPPIPSPVESSNTEGHETTARPQRSTQQQPSRDEGASDNGDERSPGRSAARRLLNMILNRVLAVMVPELNAFSYPQLVGQYRSDRRQP
ncbi:hypothetical protein FRC17_003688 [Serendipita sp. 399]|nr:hypothetical protein FRC17_003688 [Serendipita sp. 399]